MELLEGETLGERLERVGRLDWREACLIGRQVAEALGAVHDKGIVHRDLKPENLFLVREARDPAAIMVKVLDFGVAKLLAHDGATHLTMRGMIVGTPEYMSPEQCVGSELDHRADIYALGCILFEMLAGLPPFVGDTVQELLSAHRFFPAPPLTSSGVAAPAWLAELLARMLAKEPGQRPSSMHEVAAAIRAHETTATVAPLAASAASASPVVERRAAVRRVGARRAAIAFALASAVVLAGAVWRAQRRPVRSAHANPASVAEMVVHAEPPAVPVVAATRPTEVVVPVPPAAVAPTSLERRPERATRAARPARPAASQPRSVDADGIIDL
jgi:serine/threonine-protein kinase